MRAFYGTAGAPAWLSANSLSSDATAALALLAQAPAHGLRPTDYGREYLGLLRDSLARPGGPVGRARQRARFDVYLSDAVLGFMRDVDCGRLHRYTASLREKAAGPSGQSMARLRMALTSHAVPAAMLAGPPNIFGAIARAKDMPSINVKRVATKRGLYQLLSPKPPNMRRSRNCWWNATRNAASCGQRAWHACRWQSG